MTAYNTKPAIKQHLREQLAKAANAYALELHNMWDIKVIADDYWIGGDENPCGAPYQIHSHYFLSLDTIQYIVDNDITQEEYDEYQDYAQRVATVSDRLYLMGFREWREYPERRYKPGDLAHIQMLHDELEKEIESMNSKKDLTDYGKAG